MKFKLGKIEIVITSTSLKGRVKRTWQSYGSLEAVKLYKREMSCDTHTAFTVVKKWFDEWKREEAIRYKGNSSGTYDTRYLNTKIPEYDKEGK